MGGIQSYCPTCQCTVLFKIDWDTIPYVVGSLYVYLDIICSHKRCGKRKIWRLTLREWEQLTKERDEWK